MSEMDHEPPAVLPAEPSGDVLSAPAPPEERIAVLDLIRGVAILGILPANIPHFYGPFGIGPPVERDVGDRIVIALTLLLVDTRFITMLSFLFGAGLELQSQRANAAGRPFVLHYVWRQLLLLGIGILHALLLWFGDILAVYSIISMGALFCVRLFRGRGLFWCMVGCYLVFLLWATLLVGYAGLANIDGPPTMHPIPTDPKQERPVTFLEAFRNTGQADGGNRWAGIQRYFGAENQVRIYRNGTLGDMIVHRALLFVFLALAGMLYVGPYLLGCFLLGATLVRRGVFQHPEAHLPLIRRLIVWGLVVGVPCEVAAVACHEAPAVLGRPIPILRALEEVLHVLGAPGMSLAYVGLLTLWCQSGAVRWLRDRLAAVGRMALSCYLAESLLCGLVFYSYGLRLYGRLDRMQASGVVVAVWVVLLVAAPLWLRVFRMGPVEWTWRSLVDLRVRPLLRRGTEGT